MRFGRNLGAEKRIDETRDGDLRRETAAKQRVGENSEDMYKFEKLSVYKKALEFNREIFEITKFFPAGLRFSLTSQIIRASISVCANIAEGAGRYSKKESRNFYNIARGSIFEVVSLLDIALMEDFISKKDHNRIYSAGEEISKMLTGLIKFNEK